MQMSDNVIIGVDGGGSKSLATVISLEDPNLVLSKARAGPCNGYEMTYCYFALDTCYSNLGCTHS